MGSHATSRIWETSLQNCQILGNLLGYITIFRLLKSDFPHTKFDFLQLLSDFLQRLSAFFNGFPVFLNSFPLSSTAFRFPRNPIKSIYGNKYKRSLFELRFFHRSLPELCNSCYNAYISPNSLPLHGSLENDA
jgi:hypothetical protein